MGFGQRNIDDVSFFVLENQLRQQRIWPAFATAPAGWRVVFGEAECAACLEHMDQLPGAS